MIKIIFFLFSISTCFADEQLFKLVQDYRTLSKKFYLTTKKDVSRIKDIAARRFINLPDWEKHLESTNEAKPAAVYSPMPETWVKWQKTAFGPVKDFIESGEEISFKELVKWHKHALSGKLGEGIKAGKLKVNNNYGANFKRAWALTGQEIDNIRNFKFSLATARLDWTDLVCKEDLPLGDNGDFPPGHDLRKNNIECQKLYETAIKYQKIDPLWANAKKSIDQGDLFLDSNPDWAKWFWFACWPRAKRNLIQTSSSSLWKKVRQFQRVSLPSTREIASSHKSCGMVHYPDPLEVKPLLEKLLQTINKYFRQRTHSKALIKNSPSLQISRIKIDLQFAIKVQRELAAIHPFQDGNGRISRFLMDLITTRANLPTIFIPDMNNDYSANFSEYYEWAVKSVATSNEIIRECLLAYENQPFKEYQKSSCGFLFEYLK